MLIKLSPSRVTTVSREALAERVEHLIKSSQPLERRIEKLLVQGASPKSKIVNNSEKARLAAQAIYEQAALSAAALKAKHRKEMVTAILLLLLLAGEEAYARVYAELGTDGLKNADATQLQEQGETFATQRQPVLKEYSQKLAADLEKALIESQNEDSSPVEILRQLRHIARNTSKTMTETEAQCTVGAVQIDRLKRAGYTKKIWVTEDDDNVRHSHEECSEQGAIDIGQPFVNGLMYPGDIHAPIEEIANCRCYLQGANRK